MKKLVLIIAAVLLGVPNIQAAKEDTAFVTNAYRYGNSFIFVENGVTFSVYPDGEFDFYIDNQVNVGIGARIGNVGVTFNSGYNYNPFVQYDDYGAVIQVENIPIYYDYYGRVSQIGGVDVWYRNGRVRRVGGLNIFYNGGVFSHYTGFINVYNRHYVYRPFHRYFIRPSVGFCNVYTRPYRRYYRPIRYTYYRPYRHNYRRSYAHRGKVFRHDRYNDRNYKRGNIYRNDKRVTRRNHVRRDGADYGRSNRYTGRNDYRNNDYRKNNTVSRSNRSVKRGTGVDRSVKQGNYRNSNSVRRNNEGRTVTQRQVTKRPNSRTVTKREVTSTPKSRTVTRSTSTTYRKPQTRNNN
ncbi:MAG: hypothetical protein AB3N10_20580, partial [Allomuricauda sp.]